MASGRAILQAHIDGLFPESVPVEFQWTLLGVLEILPTSLSSGDNTLSVPSGTKLIVLTPPTTNAATLKLKGAGGDTGVTIRPAESNPFPWSAGTVIINASTSVNPVTLTFLG